MGSSIVKIEDRYLIWSSIVDAPTTFGMPLEEFRQFYRDEYGRVGMRDLDERLKRADERGTSSYIDYNADDVMWPNRAGPSESSLSREEIIEFYVRRRENPTQEALDVFRRSRKLVPCPIETCPEARGRDCGKRCAECWGSGWRKCTHPVSIDTLPAFCGICGSELE